ncbi:MAG: MFS transporter, partial [Pseudomonadota bacterium]
LAQLMIGTLAGVELYVAYTLLTMFCCASLLPLTLTRVSPPAMTGAPRLKPLLAIQRSPLAVSGVIVAGLTGSAYRMVGPIYGAEIGLSAEEVGLFLAALIVGGAVAQYPAGWLADRYDRRWVLIGFSLASIIGCMASSLVTGADAAIAASAAFGLVTVPIYSVAAAHAHDFATSDERAELSAALIFYFALGAIISPVVVAQLIDVAGPRAFFGFIAVGHAGLVIYGLYRMLRRPTVTDKTAYVYAPRTSFLIGRLLRDKRDGKPGDKPDGE